MKKFSTLVFALAVCASANAESTLKMLSFGSLEGPGIGEPGMIGLGISPNGKYVCGTLESGVGIFIGDLENDKMIYQVSDGADGGQLMNVNDEGVAIGFDGTPGVTFNIDGVETLLRIPNDCTYVVGEDISEDGSIAVGLFVGQGYYIYPACSKDGGIWQKLPLPDLDMGNYNTRQCGATHVSSDGKIILGYIGALGPACLWRLDESGEYVVDPIFDKYAKRTADDEEHPYLTFQGEDISPDGRYVLLKVCEYINNSEGPSLPAIYNTETGVLKVYSESQEIDNLNLGLHPTAIANDGTFIGVIGAPGMNLGSFIMKAGEIKAETLSEAFPEHAEVFELLDIGGYHMPVDISADGKYILGNGWYSQDENPYSGDAYFYFMTYVIDRTEINGISEIGNDIDVAMPTDYFTIDGLHMKHPVKGLNLIRMSDGSVCKVLK